MTPIRLHPNDLEAVHLTRPHDEQTPVRVQSHLSSGRGVTIVVVLGTGPESGKRRGIEFVFGSEIMVVGAGFLST